MRTAEDGCSTCPAGEERWEEFWVRFMTQGGRRIRGLQYAYRTPEGRLFSCVAPSLGAARKGRDKWLAKQGGIR
jgi:hypothetical protein